MPDIQGLSNALTRVVGTRLHNCAYRVPTILGLMMGLDNYYNTPVRGRRFQPVGIKGGKMRCQFISDIPLWDGADPMNPDYNARRVDLVKKYMVKGIEIMPSALVIEQPVDRYEVDRFDDHSQLRDYHLKVADMMVDGFATTVDHQLWPQVQAVGGGGYQNTQGRIMQFAYPLQNGHVGNDPAAATNPYTYMTLDMNNNLNFQALNVGSDTQPFTVNERNVVENVIMPLRDRGANIDLVIAGKRDFSILREDFATSIRQTPGDLKWAGSYFQLENGLFVVYESGIDRLPKKEMYIGDSSTLRFGMSPRVTRRAMSYIDPYPGLPDTTAWQGYIELAFFNECPRWWGRIYNTTE